MVKSEFYFYPKEDKNWYNKNRHPVFGTKWLKMLLEWDKTFVYVGVFYLTFTTLFFEGYQIPSNSMLPTLNGDPHILKGDRIFAQKGIFRLWPLKRGDIVIFISVEDQKTFIVKRLVGMPGDKIRIKFPNVYVNG